MNSWLSHFEIDRHSRILIIAPHPDDEAIPTGVLLQQASAAGAQIRIIYLTSGENNPWPQRVIEGRWRINATARARWASRRRKEALAALAHLGIRSEAAVFWEYPDQKITDLLMNGDDRMVFRLGQAITTWSPTVLVVPSLDDLHPDHSATAVLIRQMMAGLNKTLPRRLWLDYLVHTRRKDLPAEHGLTLPFQEKQRMAKRLAILSHKTQIKLRPRELPAKADKAEHFFRAGHGAEPVHPHHPVRESSFEEDGLNLKLRLSASPYAFGPGTLYLAANRQGKAGARIIIKLPLYSTGRSLDMVDTSRKLNTGAAWFCGRPGKAQLKIPISAFMPADQVFVKINRRFGFFDEAGWRDIPVCPISA